MAEDATQVADGFVATVLSYLDCRRVCRFSLCRCDVLRFTLCHLSILDLSHRNLLFLCHSDSGKSEWMFSMKAGWPISENSAGLWIAVLQLRSPRIRRPPGRLRYEAEGVI